MGLDMYVYRSRGKYRSLWQEGEGAEVETCDGIPVPVRHLGIGTSQETADLVGYFRKVNCIHNWIVQNVAGGEDECQEIPLHAEHVDALLGDIRTALADPQGNDVLPPTSGFFFGSTERDDYYVSDLEDALSVFTWLSDTMKRDAAEVDAADDWHNAPTFRYWYQASW